MSRVTLKFFILIAALISNSLSANDNNCAVINDSKSDMSHIHELLKDLKEGQMLRVIVTLNTDDSNQTPEKSIKCIQNQLLEEFYGFNIEHIKSYTALPMMVLKVDNVALEQLMNSPIVSAISVDRLMQRMDVPTNNAREEQQ